jgi:isocitrate dehydrogenase
MSTNIPITIAYGDGIGPEIMRATLAILEAAQAAIAPQVIEIGEKMYLQGFPSGIPDAAWDSLKNTCVLLKGPITTPQGGGYKSLNVTLRQTLGLYANVRPCVSYAPYVPTAYPDMDLVIIRENEEGTYAGIEHRQTEDVYQCLKLISRPACERIMQYAFEYARTYNRKKVTCLSKDNIMKMTDGLFHRVFDETAKRYPDIAHEHLIVDIGTALVAAAPKRFDVIVTQNLYGDIISDVAAQVAGSVGLAGSANIGKKVAMFEAIHGSAPDIAGKDIANPSGLLHAAIQMLIHIGQPDVAANIENAWLATLEAGLHTADIFSPQHSKKKLGTQEFAQAVIQHLGQKPSQLKAVDYKTKNQHQAVIDQKQQPLPLNKQLVGVDIFIDNAKEISAAQLAEQLAQIQEPLSLIVINSRGLKIWPESRIDEPYLRHCCCRFQSASDLKQLKPIKHEDIIKLLTQFATLGLDVIKTENLYTYNGERGFSLAQGQ